MKEICEICEKPTDFIKEHHINSRAFKGSNKESNKAYICSDCHDKIHYGLIIIEGRFGSLSGKILIFRNFNERSVTGLPDPEVWLKPNYIEIREKHIRNQRVHASVSEA